MDNEIMVGNPTTTLTIPRATREQNAKIVKCEVNNIIGKSEETETLDVHCKLYNFYLLSLAGRRAGEGLIL